MAANGTTMQLNNLFNCPIPPGVAGGSIVSSGTGCPTNVKQGVAPFIGEPSGMTISWDANGYPYDVATGNYVNVTYDDQGNAINADTNEIIDTAIAPSGQTVWTQSSGGAALATTLAQVAGSIFQPTYMQYPQGYYSPYSPYSPYSTSTYRAPYAPTNQFPTTTTTSGIGLGASVSRSGVGLTGSISPTTLLIGAVIVLAIFMGKK